MSYVVRETKGPSLGPLLWTKTMKGLTMCVEG